RDYWEREGGGVYVSWRVPDFSTVSFHVRQDTYRSLALDRGVRSWFHQDRPLRDNPAIDDGESHSLLVRLERLAPRSSPTRAGLYHGIEFERAGSELGGDFDYSRILGDLRSVVRMTPATSLSLRAVAGTCTRGLLPRQKRFELGGVDGLRGHDMGAFTGNQLAAAQAEYTVGLWALRGEGFEQGVHAIAFLDTGIAWDEAHDVWNVGRQRFATDGGLGVSTSEDDLRLYVARDLQRSSSPVVWSLRLRRPF